MSTFSDNVTVDAIGVAKGGRVTDTMIDLREVVKPQVIPSLYRRYGGGFDTLGFFQTMGRVKPMPVGDSILYGYEENRPHRQIAVVTGASATTAGAAMTIVVNNSDGYLRQHDEIPVGSGIVICQITSAVTSSATLSLEIKPKNVLATIPTVANGTLLSIISNNYGDGTGNDGGTSSGVTKFAYKAQIIKETYAHTGRAVIKEMWFPVREKSKGSIIGYTSDGILRLSHLMRLKQDYTFMWGAENTNSLTDFSDATKASTGTKGLFPLIQERGASLVGVGTSFSTANMDTIHKYLLQQGATSGIYCWMVGIDLFNSIRDGLATYFAAANGSAQAYINAAKVFAALGINGDASKEISAVVNYTAIQWGDATHIFKVMPTWSDPMMLGSEYYKFGQKGIVFPISKVSDAKSGLAMDNIEIRYLAKDGYNRMSSIEEEAYNGTDQTTYHQLADMMFVFRGSNQAIYVEM